MGTSNQMSVQLTFKVNPVLRQRIDEEQKLHGGTLSEFLNDAVKFYCNHLEERRIELQKLKKE